MIFLWQKLSRRRTRESSPEQKHKRLREGDERDIPFEELELEEVDCYDELGEDCCQFTDGVSRTGASQSGEDENVDSARTLPRSHGDSILDDDFPDLCEDIDVDAMRRAAAAANNDLSANDAKLPEVISPPSKGAAAIISEDPRGGYADSQSSSCSSRSFRRNISDDRRDEARRRHHYEERRDRRMTRGGQTQQLGSRRREDRYRERNEGSSRGYRSHGPSSTKEPSTSFVRVDRTEGSSNEGSGIISVKGPLAHATDVTEKIPSLLDMCMTGGLSPTTTAAPPSLIESVIRDDLAVAGGGSRGQTYADTKKSGRTATKNRSLLDMDIPPPDRDTMRRYAIVLNSCELTKRHSNSRSGNHKHESSSKNHYDRGSQPRAYINGVRKESR
ncbi:unnamed protein product [Heligmosomoides polygyrus]|uniref:Uncharacterized protein n=1 Tax=Heligmosomoides polygyrus TaxID=6339 RepID=A0A183G5A8_HELPZ|nr:unnamed protein product [Heligmosomoides polygyrus]